LYFCWGCVNDLAYQVLPQNRFKIINMHYWHKGPSFQYEPYPSHFDRRPLALTAGLPDEARAVLAAWNRIKDPMGRRLSARRHQILAECLGHPVSTSMSLFHSQFGGKPTQRWWGEETTRCPNKECPGRLPSGPRGEKGRAMSFLAGVLNDPLSGLPMVEKASEVTERWWNFFVSVQFHICGKCWTVHACNRSD
jgi:hypothetical protein